MTEPPPTQTVAKRSLDFFKTLTHLSANSSLFLFGSKEHCKEDF
jgi:hypothetical protein